MSNKNNKKKNKGVETMTEAQTSATAPETGETIDETTEAATEETGAVEEPVAPPVVEEPIVPPVVEPPAAPIVQPTVTTTAAKSPEEAALDKLLKEYLTIMKANAGIAKDESHLMALVKIVKYVARIDKAALFSQLFNELFQGENQYILAPGVVFQKLQDLHDPDLKRVKIMYAVMHAMRQHLDRPKNSGFPLDIKHVQAEFGGTTFGPFIKKTMGL